jgi:hypothetical protein
MTMVSAETAPPPVLRQTNGLEASLVIYVKGSPGGMALAPGPLSVRCQRSPDIRDDQAPPWPLDRYRLGLRDTFGYMDLYRVVSITEGGNRR